MFEVEGGNWFDRVPPPAVPVPAALAGGDLTGRPAMLVRPGIGLLNDLRIAAPPVDDDGLRYVDLHSEADYWRARLRPGTPALALRALLERVWVEQRPDTPAEQAPGTPADPYDVWLRLAPAPDIPGIRRPVPARTVRHLHGRRIIQVTPLGWAWNLRAISDPYDLHGEITVNCCSAEGYHRWLIEGIAPAPAPLPLYLLWTE